MRSEEYIRELSYKWVENLLGKEFNSTSEEMCFLSYAYQDGYIKGYNDANGIDSNKEK